MEGEGRFVKGFITERRKGLVYWVRFGEDGLRTLLKSIEICCKEVHTKKNLNEGRMVGSTRWRVTKMLRANLCLACS